MNFGQIILPVLLFTVATTNAYELNNLDNEMLDAPTSYKLNPGLDDSQDSLTNFTSLPCETLLLACKTENDLKNSVDDSETCLYVRSFHKQNPMYQSAQVQLTCKRDNASGGSSNQDRNLVKWKGVTLAGNDEVDARSNLQDKTEYKEDSQESEADMSAGNSQRISLPNAQKDLNLDDLEIDSNEYAVSFLFFLCIGTKDLF